MLGQYFALILLSFLSLSLSLQFSLSCSSFPSLSSFVPLLPHFPPEYVKSFWIKLQIGCSFIPPSPQQKKYFREFPYITTVQSNLQRYKPQITSKCNHMKDPKDRTAKLSFSQITDQEIMIKIKKKIPSTAKFGGKLCYTVLLTRHLPCNQLLYIEEYLSSHLPFYYFYFILI